VSAPWHVKARAVLFAIFCFELGVFLLVFPWMDRWSTNYFALLTPESYDAAHWYQWWRLTWNSGYFRGAISGIGLLNIYISLAAVARLREFASAEDEDGDDAVQG
jgi:hypothetical protein